MATAPWFVISPTALLSTIGLLRGPDRTVPTPTEDWRTAVVDVVIPAYKEEDNIVHCLASIARRLAGFSIIFVTATVIVASVILYLIVAGVVVMQVFSKTTGH